MNKIGETYFDGKVPEGTKVKFAAEKQRYTVRASNVAFSICTKPLNMIRRVRGGHTHEKTVLYTIIDWRQNIRGPENLVFGMGAETGKDCREMLERLTEGESEVSHRRYVELDIERVEFPKQKRMLKRK